MAVFIVLETADIEIIGLNVFAEFVEAGRRFNKLCEENGICDEAVQREELPGTLRIAGDDAYAVQLIQR